MRRLNKRLCGFAILIVWFFMLFSLSLPAADPVKIKVLDKEFIAPKNKVYLGDIANFEGGTKKVRKNLENLFVSYSPSGRQHIRISQIFLKTRIARANIDDGNFVLDAPLYIKIFPKNTYLVAKDFKRVANNFLKKKNLWTNNMMLKRLAYKGKRQVPSGGISYKCRVIDEGKKSGLIMVKVVALVDGEVIDTVDVSYVLNPLKRFSASRKFNSISSNKGKKVRSGDTLKIHFIKKNMSIIVEGTLVGSGRIGQNVRIKTKKSKKIFNAFLKNSSLAIVKM